MLCSIVIKIIPYSQQIFSTGGYWKEDKEGNVELWISKVKDWRFIVALLFHELIEWAWCKIRGITTEMCDAFDAYYEGLYRQGVVSVDKDPGDDKRCPYYRGHWWGKIFERLVIFILRASWKEYCKAYDELYVEKQINL